MKMQRFNNRIFQYDSIEMKTFLFNRNQWSFNHMPDKYSIVVNSKCTIRNKISVPKSVIQNTLLMCLTIEFSKFDE